MRSRIWVLRALGAILLLSAMLKSLDLTAFAVQVSYYGIVREPRIVWAIALGMIALESALGMAALLGVAVRRVTLPAIAALLVWFTGLLGWAWAFRDIENCGCFGKYLPMTPPEAILKNIVMLAMAAYAFGRRPERNSARAAGAREPSASAAPAPCLEQTAAGPDAANPHPGTTVGGSWRFVLLGVTTLAVTTFAVAYGGFGVPEAAGNQSAASSPDAPFAKYSVEWEGKTISLAQGTYIVAMISDSCEHCGEIVESLNQLAETPDLPQVVGLVLGEGDTLERFREEFGPRFPTRLIPVLEFFNLIGDHPPRFYVVEQGKAGRYWDTEVPPTDQTLLDAIARPKRSGGSEGE